ncbi:MAG: hypothetical protein ACRDRT_03290, partial [Pseudonocardiaceae bacterium]
LNAGTYTINATITALNQYALKIFGAGIAQTYLQWNGDATSDLLRLSDIRNGELRDFSILVPSGKTLQCGIRTINDAAAGVVPGQNRFERIQMSPNGTGVLTRGFIAGGVGTNGNNDFCRYSDCEVQNAVEAGFSLEFDQSTAHIFENCIATGGQAGLRTDKATSPGSGGFQWIGGEIANTTDCAIIVKNPGGDIRVQSAAFEANKRILRTVGGLGNIGAVRLDGNRFACDGMHADNIIIDFEWGGPLLIEGNYFSGPVNVPPATERTPQINYHPPTAQPGGHAYIHKGNYHQGAPLTSLEQIFPGQLPTEWGANWQIYITQPGAVAHPEPIAPTFYLDRNQAWKILAVAFTASWTPEADAALIQRMTLTANLTINAPTRAYKGQWLLFELSQDATGGRTMTFNAVFKKNWTPVTTANAINTIMFTYNGTNWLMIGKGEGLT